MYVKYTQNNNIRISEAFKTIIGASGPVLISFHTHTHTYTHTHTHTHTQREKQNQNVSSLSKTRNVGNERCIAT